jgi:hypothetical protein
MSALDRLKAPVFREGTDLAIVNRHDLALVLAVVDAAQGVVELSNLVTERFPDTRVPNNLADEFYAYYANGSASVSFTTLHAITDALAALTEDKP